MNLPVCLVVFTALSAVGFVDAKVKTYYLKIEEIIWDYAPSNVNELTGNLLAEEKVARIYSDMYIGKKYKKAVYRRFTDDTYTVRMQHDPNLGFMGPTIRAEVGDVINIHLWNNATVPYSIHPHGVLYNKANEGALYADNTTDRLKQDDSVPPGGRHSYEWIADKEYGPQPDDPNCLTWTYHSHVHSEYDVNSGLIGALIICRPGTYKEDETRTDVDHEFVALFFIPYEIRSHYFEENLKMFVENPDEVDIEEKYFDKGNKMHVVNGHMYANTPGYDMCQGDTVSWHVIGMGSNRDLHTVHFQGQTISHDHHRRDSFIAVPATLRSVVMRADNPGQWTVGCKLYNHWQEGMYALFNVDPTCRNPSAPRQEETLTGATRQFYVQAEEVDWDFGPTGYDGLTNLSLTEPDTDAEVYFETGPERIGGVYKKAIFLEYTDVTFTEQSSRPENLGILGPVIYGEVGDTIEITLKNTGSHPFNMEPHGVFFDKPLTTSGRPKYRGEPAPVEPGQQGTYTWTIPEAVSPSPLDPNCLTYLYVSTIDFEKDSVSGLSGPLLVCKKGTLEQELQKRNLFVLMTVFDESRTWYFKENLQRLENADTVDTGDDDFKEANIMHALNGYMYSNLGGVEFCTDEDTTVRLFAVGTKTDIHSVRIDGVSIRQNGVPTGVVHLFPHTSATITVRANAQGHGSLFCRVNDHLSAGTTAVYQARLCGNDNDKNDNSDEEKSNQKSSSIARTYYVTAEETIWDYNPSKTNAFDEPTDIEGNMGFIHEHYAPGKFIGSKYKKVLYYEYTDDTFTTKKPTPEHLGFLGPVLQGEAGENIEIYFLNKANRAYNMFPWGAVDAEALQDADQAVQPGETKRYVWMIPESASPTANQPSCLSSVYVSSVDKVADVSDGLMGPLLICRKGGLSDTSVDRDFFLQFQNVDENLSHYLDDNIAMFLKKNPETFEGGDAFEESNKMKAINGRFWNLGGLDMFEEEVIRWHLIGWGSEKDYHPVHFHGHTYEFINDGRHTGDVFEVYPGFLGTVTMKVKAVGSWLLHCHVFDHINGGMEAVYRVLPKRDQCNFRNGDGRGGRELFQRRIETEGECIRRCAYLQRTENGAINGVTFGTFTAKCYCEINMSSIKFSSTPYKTCFLKGGAMTLAKSKVMEQKTTKPVSQSKSTAALLDLHSKSIFAIIQQLVERLQALKEQYIIKT